ncbi:MAG TPA: hypothetical protein VFE53_03210 [Mucilaginibacter sp.]|jgi:hypothetical protein|nr:hypothetical protein [Mucilaginibacter sp.]
MADLDYKHSIKLELIKFLLIFIAGGAITLYWQHLDHQYLREAEKQDHHFAEVAELKKYEKNQATIVFEENSKMLGKVIIDFKLLAEGKTLKNEWQQDYIDWKENLIGIKALVIQYYGEQVANSLDGIDNIASSLFEKYWENAKSGNKADPEALTEVNQLDNYTLQFNMVLIHDILDDRIGSFR